MKEADKFMDSNNRTIINCRITPADHQAFKIALIKRHETMQQALVTMIHQYIEATSELEREGHL